MLLVTARLHGFSPIGVRPPPAAPFPIRLTAAHPRRTLAPSLFRGGVQCRSGLVDLVVGVGGDLGGAHCLAFSCERVELLATEDSAQMCCRSEKFRVCRHGEGS